MMISFKYMNDQQIIFDTYPIQNLVIENKQLYRKIISEFENDEQDESFTFSLNFKPFEFSKKGIYITNPLNVDLENKKLSNKISMYLENIANSDFEDRLIEIKQKIIELADELSASCDFDSNYDFNIETPAIIKLLKFKIGSDTASSEEKLLEFMILFSKYLQIDFFVIPNMHLFFTDELEKFFETLNLHHINLLCIECFSDFKISEFEQTHIIDKDLCEIDNPIIK